MFEVFQEEKLLSTLLFVSLSCSIFLRVFLGMLYQNMINETDNMAITDNRLLRQCKTKFSNCYQMGNGVANIPVFVDKFLNRMAFGWITFSTIYHLSGQTMLLSVVFAGVGICKSIAVGRTLGDILPFYIVSFIGLYLYFSISTFVDIKGKRRVLKVNLIDYLENHLSPRINVTNRDIEMLYGEAIYEEKPMIGRQNAATGERRAESAAEERRARRRAERETVTNPKENRVIELMPIGNRKAAGGETLTSPAETPEQSIITQEELEALLHELIAY